MLALDGAVVGGISPGEMQRSGPEHNQSLGERIDPNSLNSGFQEIWFVKNVKNSTGWAVDFGYRANPETHTGTSEDRAVRLVLVALASGQRWPTFLHVCAWTSCRDRR